MRSIPRLGSVNAALVALYFAPVWGSDGLRALISPFHGFEDRTAYGGVPESLSQGQVLVLGDGPEFPAMFMKMLVKLLAGAEAGTGCEQRQKADELRHLGKLTERRPTGRHPSGMIGGA